MPYLQSYVSASFVPFQTSYIPNVGYRVFLVRPFPSTSWHEKSLYSYICRNYSEKGQMVTGGEENEFIHFFNWNRLLTQFQYFSPRHGVSPKFLGEQWDFVPLQVEQFQL